jgi:plastocyanin
MKRVVIILAVLAVLIGVGFGVYSHNHTNNNSSSNSANSTNSNTSQQTTTNTNAPQGTINIANMMFSPSQITVAVGGSVTWTNNDSIAHTVTDDLSNVDGPNSGNIAPGASYTFTFKKAGSYQYHCDIHHSMRGTIVVK